MEKSYLHFISHISFYMYCRMEFKVHNIFWMQRDLVNKTTELQLDFCAKDFNNDFATL